MKPRRSLRTRLLVAFIALAAGVLALAGATTYLLASTSAKHDALDELGRKADAVVENSGAVLRLLGSAVDDTSGAESGPIKDRVRGIAVVLRLADARIVYVTGDGQVVNGTDTAPALLGGPGVVESFTLPAALEQHVGALHTDRLLQDEQVAGSVGSTVFVAKPVEQLAAGRRARLRQQHAVLVLTKHVDTNVVGTAGPSFLVAAAGALAVSIAVAFWLARRMTRPVRDIEAAARRLAAGDLTARAAISDQTDGEIASLATTLNHMADQLEQARGAERAFLLSISHDLRTPLTSIRGYAEALADGTLDGNDSEARARAASVITSEARRLERLVRDLLDLSRLDSHEFSLRPRRCDAAEVIADAAEAFAPTANDMGVTLAVERNGQIAADLDADRLAQVVANLVENALKYANAKVDVLVRSDNGAIEVSVVDDGPGVAEQELARVFERLYIGRDTPGRAVGTGLGLAIVRELAHAMGGTAHAARDTNGGARFVVRVPLGQ
jgi:two-component system sensor histidine kinase BaeS